MTLYSALLRPLLFRAEPEWTHDTILWAASALRAPLIRTICDSMNARFAQHCRKRPTQARAPQIGGVPLLHPIGLAAGFDKNAVALELFERLGFSHIEIGTVTPRPQSGNPRPRIFRYPNRGALINRMGFPSQGAEAVARRLRRWRGRPHAVKLGINIGKNKETPFERAHEDYLTAFRQLAPFADYVAINVSSPNTPGLRALQDPEPLRRVLGGLQEENQGAVPLLLKISPDLVTADLEAIVRVCVEMGMRGIVATNTTLDRTECPEGAAQQGGLSGQPLRNRARRILTELREIIGADATLDIVAVGGVRSAADALTYLSLGASAVQVYTGLVYEGPGLVGQILAGLRQA